MIFRFVPNFLHIYGIARAILENRRGVEVSILPENQTGRLGENLAFTVTVKNTGEVSDTYDLTMSDDVDWGRGLTRAR